MGDSFHAFPHDIKKKHELKCQYDEEALIG
jgi:hypothetical protein